MHVLRSQYMQVLIVHACTMIIVHACTMIVHACTMIIVHGGYGGIEKLFSGKFKFGKEPLNFIGTRETLARSLYVPFKSYLNPFSGAQKRVKKNNFSLKPQKSSTHSENP